MPGLDNHAMGTVFEELIRRFNEENNEEAGEHFTPRDVVTLMTDLIFLPVAEQIESSTYLVYDGACGTGGMLTLADERLQELAERQAKSVSIHIFGQELQPETYAIATADLLLKGEGEEAENIVHGSTLSRDAFPDKRFDFMLSNPPYGKSWKTDLDKMSGKKDFRDPRFVITHADDPEFSLVTRSSDGQLLFLVNKLHKMKYDTPLGCGNGQLDFETQVRPVMEKYLKSLPIDVFIYPEKESAFVEHLDTQTMKEWLRSEPASLPFSEAWDDLVEILTRKQEFETIAQKSPFHVQMLQEPRGLRVTASGHTYTIHYESLLAFWQQLRTHGFSMRHIAPSLSRELSYLIPVFAELPYVTPVHVAEVYQSLNTATITGLQILPAAFNRQISAQPQQLSFFPIG